MSSGDYDAVSTLHAAARLKIRIVGVFCREYSIVKLPVLVEDRAALAQRMLLKANP